MACDDLQWWIFHIELLDMFLQQDGIIQLIQRLFLVIIVCTSIKIAKASRI